MLLRFAADIRSGHCKCTSWIRNPNQMLNSGDVEMGGGRFPSTRHSVIEALRTSNPELRSRAMDLVISAYWKPVYKYLRLKYRQNPEDSEDLTQGFFLRVVERSFFTNFDPAKARFRTFLRLCLDRYIANEIQSQSRVKRGGGQEVVSFNFADAESELQPAIQAATLTPEEYFDREWIRSLFSRAVEALRLQAVTQGKELQLKIFELYDLEPDSAGAKITYGQLAKEFGLSQTDITNYLADMRRRFRTLVLELLRQLTASEDEFRLEVRAILGIEVQ
jgi:RNA polymerase sigma factor (sigma-70 family)